MIFVVNVSNRYGGVMKSIIGVLLVLATGFAIYRIVIEKSSLSTHMSLKTARSNETWTKYSLMTVAIFLIAFLYMVMDSIKGLFIGVAISALGYLIYNFIRERQTLGIIHSKKPKKALYVPLITILVSLGITGVMQVNAQSNDSTKDVAKSETKSEKKTDNNESSKKPKKKKKAKAADEKTKQSTDHTNKQNEETHNSSDKINEGQRQTSTNHNDTNKNNGSSQPQLPSKNPNKPDEKPNKPESKPNKPEEKPTEKPEEKPSKPNKPEEKPNGSGSESGDKENTGGNSNGSKPPVTGPEAGSIGGH